MATSMFQALPVSSTIMFLAATAVSSAAGPTTYELSREDVTFLQSIAKRDQFVLRLTQAVPGLEALYTLLKLAAPSGPAKLVLQWNAGAIRGWRVANEGLAKIEKAGICQDIIVHSQTTSNRLFFEALADARGCNE